VTGEADDRTVEGINITCGAQVYIDAVSTDIAGAAISLQTTTSVAVSALPSRSKSSLLSCAVFRKKHPLLFSCI